MEGALAPLSRLPGYSTDLTAIFYRSIDSLLKFSIITILIWKQLKTIIFISKVQIIIAKTAVE